MRKKYIVSVAIGCVLFIMAALFFVINYRSNASKHDGATVESKATWSVEDYVDSKDKASKVKNTTKDVDTDPKSITVLVNKEYKISKDYKPDDLVVPEIEFSFDYKDEKRYLRKEAAVNLELLFAGAKYFGYELQGVSGYRSYNRQSSIYEVNLLKYGLEYTQEYSAMPGTSEHQLGLAIDISSKSMKGLLGHKFGESKEGKWVQENAYKYGYIVRYPKNKSHITGYGYEPWHIRYVGYDLAKFLYDNNMTLDEYYEYKLNQDVIDRETYGFYDYLLTKKSEGNANVSKAVLDDIVNKNDVTMNTSAPTSTPSAATSTPRPEDIIGGGKPTATVTFTFTPIEPTATVKPTANVKPTSTVEPTEGVKPTATPEPTAEPSDETGDKKPNKNNPNKNNSNGNGSDK